MSSSWYSEDVVKLLERALLRLWQPKEDHDESDNVKPGIEAESALRCESQKHAREGKGQNRSPEIVRRHCPGHADLSMGEREDLC